MEIQRLTHLGICVSDLERSLRFYRDVLGCKEVGRLEMEGGAADTINAMKGVEIRAKPGCIGEKTPRPMNHLGLTHLSLRVDDLEAVCAQLEAAGGALLPETRIGGPDAPTHVIMAYDPDGVRLELIQGPGDPNAVPGSPGYLAGD
jgi:glyoxylase I family protein